MEKSKNLAIKIKYVCYAQPEQVFQALTDQSQIEDWSGGKAIFEMKEEGQIELFDGWVKGKIIHFDKGKALSFTWKPNEWKTSTPPSTVELILKRHDAGTEVVINHFGFPDQKEADSHKVGWIDFVLDPVNDFFIK